MSGEKICPLCRASAINYTDAGMMCKEDECAWWVQSMAMCAERAKVEMMEIARRDAEYEKRGY